MNTTTIYPPPERYMSRLSSCHKMPASSPLPSFRVMNRVVPSEDGHVVTLSMAPMLFDSIAWDDDEFIDSVDTTDTIPAPPDIHNAPTVRP